MKAEITPSLLNGTVTMPSSKSYSHRAIICAALAQGTSRIRGISDSADISATVGAVRALGAEVTFDGGDLLVRGITVPPERASIDCRESGSTLRFMIPIACALGVQTVFTGSGRLPERPVAVMTELLREHGVECRSDGGANLPLSVCGRIGAGEYRISGGESSQYITGLLFALSVTDGESRIVLTSPLQSAGYIDITVDTLRAFGADITKNENGFTVRGTRLSARDYTVEGDWSQAAFFLSAAAVGGKIRILGLNPNSVQGDRECLSVFRKIGVSARFEDGVLTAQGGTLGGIELDASQIPDLVPAIAATLAFAHGESRIFGAERLRIKESDRIAAVVAGLRAMGISADERPDGMIIRGGNPHCGNIDGANDHRIVMAFAAAATAVCGVTVISDAEAINKSYPAFFNDFASLGGNVKCHP